MVELVVFSVSWKYVFRIEYLLNCVTIRVVQEIMKFDQILIGSQYSIAYLSY